MNGPVITMKPLPLFIGIIVVLAVLCSPVLAISTSDLVEWGVIIQDVTIWDR